MINNYGKIYNLGHKLITKIFDDEVEVTEKIDGSQFSMMKDENGELFCRSKGKQIFLEAPDKLFNNAVSTAQSLKEKLIPGYVYRGEYLSTPSHNSLKYDRIPNKHIMIWNIEKGPETNDYLSYEEMKSEAERIGLEVVPLIYEGKVESPEFIKGLLERTSILGGQKIEGVVCKNYKRFGDDGKILTAKYVSETFKEVHRKEWKKTSPNKKDFFEQIKEELTTPARWNKSIIHAKEDGKLEDSPRDIGILIKMIQEDVIEEEKDYILEKIWNYYRPQIQRAVISGFPEYYKQQLLNKQFENE